MIAPIPLALLLALAARAPEVAGVAPVVGEDVAVAVHVDLARWDVPAFARRVLGKLADDADVSKITQAGAGWTDALKKAGARDLFLLVDPADMPGYPVAAVPIVAGADARAIAAVLTGGAPGVPVRWPAAETIRGVVVAGTPGALARLRAAAPAPAPRPEVAAALDSGGSAPIVVAIVPTAPQRRVIEEAMPNLPPMIGGGPITNVTRGITWASLSMASDPRPVVRVLVQARDAAAAKALEPPIRAGLGLLPRAIGDDPALAAAVAKIRPEVVGDRITLEADVEQAAALVMVPARQAREGARRSRSVNNLKLIALAMHNYHFRSNSFPPAYSAAKDGKPLLSWRVLILPYLEEKELFEKFHLDEPWDSPHNKALIPLMPKTYACPAAAPALAAEGKTTYLTPRGPGTIFPGPEGVKLQDITDGTSNTIFVVETTDEVAVTWTRPDDWEAAPEPQLPTLFGHYPDGTNVGFADGSVRFLRATIPPRIWKLLMTRNGGEIFSADDL